MRFRFKLLPPQNRDMSLVNLHLHVVPSNARGKSFSPLTYSKRIRVIGKIDSNEKDKIGFHYSMTIYSKVYVSII